MTYRPINPGNGVQRGGALLVMLVILVIGITTVFITSLSGTALQNRRNQSSAEALAKAKEALIGYAVTYGDTHPVNMALPRDAHGYLPCPDLNGSNGEGSSPGSCGSAGAHQLGRLPWRTLDLSALYDGAGECLWYAVSGKYKNNPAASTTMNWDNPGEFTIYADNGSIVEAGEVVAAVIAPGAPLSGNSARTASSAAPTCGGNYTAAAYLENDSAHSPAINNSDIAAGNLILPHEHRDGNGNVTSSTNDQILYITRQDIWNAIQKRIAREAKKCLDDYAATTSGDKYPWAVPVSMPTAFSPLIMGEYNTRFGRLSTRPSVQTEPTPAMITTMQSKFDALWPTLATFAANKTWANLFAMKSKADAAKSAADDVKDYYDGWPQNIPILMNAAADLKDAADAARDNLTTSSSAAAIAAVQLDLVNAANAFTSAMTVAFSQASGMANTWPASCTLFSSAQWEHWKDLVFYQVADGYKPGSAASCGNCLSVEGGGHNLAGSGNYRATIIVAGKKLTANRTTSNIGDYLEADNLLPRNDYTQPYKTHRITDAAYQSVNDFVLCLDGYNAIFNPTANCK